MWCEPEVEFSTRQRLSADHVYSILQRGAIFRWTWVLASLQCYHGLYFNESHVAITDEIHFHTADHEKPVSKSMTAFSLHLLSFILVDLPYFNIPLFGKVFSSEAFDACDRRDRSDQITQNDPSVNDLNSTSLPVIRKGNILSKSL